MSGFFYALMYPEDGTITKLITRNESLLNLFLLTINVLIYGIIVLPLYYIKTTNKNLLLWEF